MSPRAGLKLIENLKFQNKEVCSIGCNYNSLYDSLGT